MSYWSRIVNVFRGDSVNREIDEELESHLDEAREHGRDGDEARRAFGSSLLRREASRDARIVSWVDSLRADFVFGWRQLAKNRAATAAAVLSLGLAMGASLAAFRLIDALLFKPLPVADPGSLYFLWHEGKDPTGKPQHNDSFDFPQFQQLRGLVRDDAELLAVSRPQTYMLTYGAESELEKTHLQWVSGWMFGSFGLKPAVGRVLAESDDLKAGASPVAVLSYNYWTRRFGGDPNVIGRKFRMRNDVYEIVGVCAPGFTGTETGTFTDVFAPIMMNAESVSHADWSWFRIWARMKPGVSPEVVRQKLRAAIRVYREERVRHWRHEPSREEVESFVHAELHLDRASGGVSGMQRDYGLSLAVLAAVVVLVLLIACANVANLMTAQAASRAREMALRVSIGAGRMRLVQLVLVEGVLIALAASAFGWGLAWWAAPFVVSRINSSDDPARLTLTADWRVLAFAAGLVLIVTFLFGLIPALRASSVKPMSALKGGENPHARRRLMHGLLAVQVAFCFLVCFACGLFVKTLERLSHQPTGFVADRVLTLDAGTSDRKTSSHWEELRRRLAEVSGVESVATAGWALMCGNSWTETIWIGGKRAAEEPYFLKVSPGWFATMRIGMIDGREFTDHDGASDTVIVNEAFARLNFDGQNPVGRVVERADGKDLKRAVIVGYVRDARYDKMREAIRPTVYIPVETAEKGLAIVIRTASTDALAMASILRRAVSNIRSELRVTDIATQTELVEQHTVRERLLAMLSVFFAGVALVLAGIGFYGVLSYAVLQRRREIGIRMALGAPSRSVAWRVGSEVLPAILAGAAAGITAGLVSQSFFETLLYEVKAGDPVMLGAPAITTLAMAMFAALPPVFRAMRIDPAVTLRSE